METIKNISKLLKIKHYIKNLVIFLPAIFMRNIDNTVALWSLIKVFTAFSLISSAVYIFNDLKDVSADKKHPIKSKRPIASGKISPLVAKVIMAILLLLTICIGFYINIASNISIWLYFILNIAYSLGLKNIRFLDIICIAFGFVLRLSAGFYAISAPVEQTMAIMVFITSVFFTSSKRILERKFLSNTSIRHQSMRYINEKTLNGIFYGSAVLSILTFYLVVEKYSAYIPYLSLTIVCFGALICRLFYLINKTKSHDDPMNFIDGDQWIKIIAVFSLLILTVLYIG